MSLYFKRFLIVIACILVYYILVFFAVDTKGVVEEKKELDEYISSGYVLYLDGEPIDDEHIYTLITEYEYVIDKQKYAIYFYDDNK